MQAGSSRAALQVSQDQVQVAASWPTAVTTMTMARGLWRSSRGRKQPPTPPNLRGHSMEAFRAAVRAAACLAPPGGCSASPAPAWRRLSHWAAALAPFESQAARVEPWRASLTC